jgi:hypothetical protein
VNAIDILSSIESRGREVILEGSAVRIHPGIPPQDAERLRPYKPQIVALLRERSQALIRECKWPPTLPICDFLVGNPGERCKRCGASWVEHYH